MKKNQWIIFALTALLVVIAITGCTRFGTGTCPCSNCQRPCASFPYSNPTGCTSCAASGDIQATPGVNCTQGTCPADCPNK
ncbi:MAG: hypothetical protein NTX88_01415 [Candidatus Atribacteria bacterium]|nr:hypothetical protein [Candidatus Atribacteria bacterium]